jgi:hypothetical protein
MKRLLLAALLAGVCFAQTSTSPTTKKFYRLDFVLRELDGDQVVNSRNYSSIVATVERHQCSIRANSRVPVNVTPTGTNYQQFQVGVDIDCGNVEDHGDQLSLFVSAGVSSFVDKTDKAGNSPPIIRDNRWESQVIVPFRKPTVLFSSDDPSSKRKMQLVLTATPIP